MTAHIRVDVMAALNGAAGRVSPDVRNAVQALLHASLGYFLGYVQDEAAQDGCELTGCSEDAVPAKEAA